MSDAEASPASFPSVSLATWRERAEASGTLRNASLLEGPTVQVLHTERPGEDRGRPGAPPFVRGATPHAGAKLVFEVRGRSEVQRRARAAVDAGAERVRLGPEACRSLGEDGIPPLMEAVGDAEMILLPGPNALAWAAGAFGARIVDDPLSDLARTGRLPCDPKTALTRTAQRAATTEGRALEIDTRPYHEAGSGPATEIAIAASSGLDLLRALVEVGHPMADGPRKMAFTFALDSDVFLGMATLRAARWVWSKVLRALGIDGPEQGMHIHASSSLRAASRLEPMNNALRGTTSAFAAFAGGAEEISLRPFDEVAGAPSEAADRLALMTLHLLRWESHLGRVADPGGGSYHLEALTSSLARQAWAELQEIEHQGGALRGLLDGSLRERVASTAGERERAAATRRRAIVGASRYPSPERPAPAEEVVVPEGDPATAAEARSWPDLNEMKDTPLASRVAALSGPDAPALEPLPRLRLAAPFESLREGAPTASVLILAVGSPASVRARVDFARDALGVAGLVGEVQPADGLEAALALLEEHDADAVCLAAPDEDIDALVSGLLDALAVPLVVASAPRDLEGVTVFVHRKMDAVVTLRTLLDALAPDAATEEPKAHEEVSS